MDKEVPVMSLASVLLCTGSLQKLLVFEGRSGVLVDGSIYCNNKYLPMSAAMMLSHYSISYQLGGSS